MSLRTVYKKITIGERYNQITVVEDLGVIDENRIIVGLCDCGVRKTYLWLNVKRGKSKSCGCSIKKHGLHNHNIYHVWEDMCSRCYNSTSNESYLRYGGRGVTVCDEWKNNPKSFYDWALDKWEKGLQLDKDKLAPGQVGKLYCPEYCCFLTPKENAQYRENTIKFEHEGDLYSIRQLSDKYGIKYSTFRSRIKSGWSLEEILSTSLFQYNKKTA